MAFSASNVRISCELKLKDSLLISKLFLYIKIQLPVQKRSPLNIFSPGKDFLVHGYENTLSIEQFFQEKSSLSELKQLL